MVQARAAGNYKPRKSDYDPNTRLQVQTEHFDCPICFSSYTNILECPNCAARACESCAVSFSQNKKQNLTNNDRAQKNYTCNVCHEVHKMIGTNKIL